MSTLQIALAALVVALLLAWLWLRRSGGNGPAAAAPERIDTVIGWPPKATRVLSTPERIAFSTLVRALPEYMILAQVPVSRFVTVPKRNSYADWLRRVGYQCVDFVVCDMAAQVVAVVELQALQSSEPSRKRLDRITRTLKAAQIPLQVWRPEALPSVDVAREAIVPKPMPAAEPASAAATVADAVAVAVAPVAAPARLNPFDDAGRDTTQDELIEMMEPPPSTWFDDLDTDPMPPKKR